MTYFASPLPGIFGSAVSNSSAHVQTADRVDFVDYGKGICIFLVVMMHSTLGVGEAMGGSGFMHLPVEFSRPFRMPDFFLIAGLFLAKTIDAPWRRYADRKVLHFAYFFVLWTIIHLSVKLTTLPDLSAAGLLKVFAWRMIEPLSPLWFIYMLPIFFIVTRLLRAVPWPLVLLGAAALETLHVSNAGIVVDEFTQRFVYFYVGYRFAPQIFAFARRVAQAPLLAIGGLGIWALVNGLAVFVFAVHSLPLAQAPGISLILGFAGSLAVIAVAALLAEKGMWRWIGWLGARSLIVFVAFVLFMAPTRIVLIKLGLVENIGIVSLAVMAAALIGPLVMHAVIFRTPLAGTPLRYLFVWPDWAKLRNTG